MFGFLHRLERKRLLSKARDEELAGAIAEAIRHYLAAEAPDEAARLLLLRAEAESDPAARLALYAQAAGLAGSGSHLAQARQRKARLAFDLLVAPGGQPPQSELLRIAGELEASGAHQQAAEAYARAGDEEGEIRALESAGDIEALERRLAESERARRVDRERKSVLQQIRDFDTTAERHRAVALGREALGQMAADGRAQDDARALRIEIERIVDRLLVGPRVRLEVDGEARQYVLGSTVTVGRADADVLVASSAISRQHLRIYRRQGEAVVDDLGTRNGTLLGGARLDGTIAVGERLALQLAGRVALRLTQSRPGGPLELEVAGEHYLLPLGPLRLCGWEISDAHDGEDRFVVLRTPAGAAPPCLGRYRLAARIELCHGDALAARRGEPPVLVVPERAPSRELP